MELPSNCRSASIEKIEAKFKKLCDVINLNSWPQSRKKREKEKEDNKGIWGWYLLTLKFPYVTKTEFLLTISIQYQSDR